MTETNAAGRDQPAVDETAAQPGASQTTLTDLLQQALAHHRAGRLEEAEACYLSLIEAAPTMAAAWINLGVLMRRRGALKAAVLYLKRGLSLQPDDGGSWSNLGNALRALGQLKDAERAHRRALDLTPDRPETHYNFGLCLRDRGDLHSAENCFRKADALGYSGPDLAWDRSLNYLLAGHLKEGFARYEARWTLPQSPPQHIDIPRWDGRPLDGNLLVYAEQGLGDSLQFCRYLPQLTGRAHHVLFECQPPLYRLLRASPSLSAIEIHARDKDRLPPVDAAVPLLSLPRHCGTDTNLDIPADIPYLAPPTTGIPKLATGRGDKTRIGLSWAGKPSHNNDRNRSITLAQFAPLFDCANTEFFSLQIGDAAYQRDAFDHASQLQELSPHIRDFADTAALMQELDLIITVDTSLAHLAGALGKPVWVLLPYAPDWRWQLHRDDSPWYPSMTLFRQPSPGDWADVIRRVRSRLHHLTT